MKTDIFGLLWSEVSGIDNKTVVKQWMKGDVRGCKKSDSEIGLKLGNGELRNDFVGISTRVSLEWKSAWHLKVVESSLNALKDDAYLSLFKASSHDARLKIKILAFSIFCLLQNLAERWKYWIWLQEGSELANKKCFSHHYALTFFSVFLELPARAEVDEFSSRNEVSTRLFPCASYFAHSTRWLGENAKNQKMIQMTGIKQRARILFRWREEKGE